MLNLFPFLSPLVDCPFPPTSSMPLHGVWGTAGGLFIQCRGRGIPGSSRRTSAGGIMPIGGKVNPPVLTRREEGEQQVRYLVTFEGVEAGPLLPPQQVPGLLRSVVFPTQEALASWSRKGRSVGVSRPGLGVERSSWMPTLTMRPT